MERPFEPLVRWGVIGVAMLWCAIKVALLVQVSQPGALGLTPWLLAYNGAMAVLYAVAIFLAVRARYAAAAGAFVGIAALTASQFALLAWASYEGHAFAMAIAAEDTIVWTMILVGASAAAWLHARAEHQSVI